MKLSPGARVVMVVAVVMAGAATAQAFGRFTYAVLLPAVQRDLSISYTLAGGLGTANLVAYLIGTALVAVATTRVSVVRLVQLSLVGSTAGLAVLAYGRGIAWLWLGMVLTGLAGAGVWVPSPGIAAIAVPNRLRGLAIGFIGTGIGLGLVFVSLVAGTIADDQWRSVYRIEAAIGLVAIAGAFAVLRDIGAIATARPRLRVIRSIPGWRSLLAIYVVYGLSMSLFVNFLTAMLRDDAGFGASRAARMFLIFGFATVAGGPMYGRLADRVGRERAMAIAFSGMAAAAIVVLAGEPVVVGLATVVFGLGFAGVPTALAALVADSVDVQSFGAAFGVATLAFGVAQVFGPQLGGLIADTFGTFWPVFVASAGLAMAGGFIAANRRRTYQPAS